MAIVKFFKVTTLPVTLLADAFYYVENGTYAESYLTDTEGQARSIGNSAMINALIDTALDAAFADYNALEVVPNIAARDALAVGAMRNFLVLVTDATGDPTVTNGSALYVYREATTDFVKLTEYESLDVVIQWANIQGRPVSSPAHIDEAVTLRHSHANKAQLDKIGEDAEGLTYDGQPVASRWATLNW